MNEEQITTSVSEALADVPVGPAPIQRIHRDAARLRRTRYTVLTAVAASVVGIASISTWAVQDHTDGATDTTHAADRPAQPGRQVVRVGRVTVSLPETWVRVTKPTSRYCGSESPDVIAYNAPDCDATNQDAVHFLPNRPEGVSAWTQIEIDGEMAYENDINRAYEAPGDGEPTVWASQIYIPSEEVLVSVISSRDAATVRDLRDGVSLR